MQGSPFEVGVTRRESLDFVIIAGHCSVAIILPHSLDTKDPRCMIETERKKRTGAWTELIEERKSEVDKKVEQMIYCILVMMTR